MSYPPQFPPPPPSQPPRQGLSTGAKIGIGCGGCAGLVVVGFVLLMVVAVVGAPSSDTEVAVSSDAGQAEPEEVSYVVGDTVSHGDWDITITEVETGVEEVERSEYRTETPNGEFVVVRLEATNTSDEPEYFEANDQVLMDEGGAMYRREVSASDISGMDRVNPGVTVEGFLGFDVPAGFEVDHLLVNGEGRYADGVRVDLE